jgi:hypothetical protein
MYVYFDVTAWKSKEDLRVYIPKRLIAIRPNKQDSNWVL